jgi:pimeloyl-ACP methyl ester carboxylesterase
MQIHSEIFGARIPLEEGSELDGDLVVPENAKGVVLFAHGSGSSRHSPRNRYVADVLHHHALATLLIDLLTTDEERAEQETGALRFDIGFLAARLDRGIGWVRAHEPTRALPLGLFGASTGAAAALVTAARKPEVAAVVSRGGRPDLAGDALSIVRAPTLLIVGANDPAVLGLNRDAFRMLRAVKRLDVIPGASHLLSEPGTLEKVASLAAEWFELYLGP